MTPQSPVLLNLSDLPELIFAKNQPQYTPLPALIKAGESGVVTTRWQLSWPERLRVFFSGNIWLQVLTFKAPLQPVKIMAKEPFLWECK